MWHLEVMAWQKKGYYILGWTIPNKSEQLVQKVSRGPPVNSKAVISKCCGPMVSNHWHSCLPTAPSSWSLFPGEIFFLSMKIFSAGKMCPVTFVWPEPARRWQQPCIARAGDLAQWLISQSRFSMPVLPYRLSLHAWWAPRKTWPIL